MTATIALVDDDRNILTSVSIALQTEGFTTRVYSDGEVALKAFAENPPDLAVLDIKMPRMDGLELLRRLRERSRLPVIFPAGVEVVAQRDEIPQREREPPPTFCGEGELAGYADFESLRLDWGGHLGSGVLFSCVFDY